MLIIRVYNVFMIEGLKEISGFDGRYFINDSGVVVSRNGVIIKFQKLNGRLIAPLYDGKKIRRIFVHRIVLTEFGSKCEGERVFVNHKDGNPLNNRISNLEWVTRSENLYHSFHTLGNDNLGKGNYRVECKDLGVVKDSINTMGKYLLEIGAIESPGSFQASCSRRIKRNEPRFVYKGLEFIVH